MNQFTLSKRSLDMLHTCHPDLILIIETAIKRTTIDFGVSEGERTLERQQQLFAEKKSRCDGVTKKSKHQSKPSMAVDIYAFVNKANWSTPNLAYLGGVITAVAAELLDKKLITHKVRWGANWDMDGEIITDQDFQDLPHFEIIPC